MIKPFLPKVCPECGAPLIIEQGKQADVLRLLCSNRGECSGAVLKKLQKGIIALDINGLGPSTIEKLAAAGIESAIDLFDPAKFSEQALVATGEFVKGRALEKILTAVGKVKEIPIHKAILALQIKDIGRTFSEKIGQIVSGMDTDMTGLQLDVREQLSKPNSALNTNIRTALARYEALGIKIIKHEVKVVDPATIQKVNKTVALTLAAASEAEAVLAKLNWGMVDIKDPACQMLIVLDKNESDPFVEYAKANAIKIMTLKQVTLVFG